MVIHVRSVYLIFGSFQISFSKRYSKYMFRIYIGMSIFLIINILNTSIYLILAELHGSSKKRTKTAKKFLAILNKYFHSKILFITDQRVCSEKSVPHVKGHFHFSYLVFILSFFPCFLIIGQQA